MDQHRYNLLTAPWVPVTWATTAPDQPERVGLLELFTRSHEIADFNAPLAPASSGLLRVLVVLAARITGLDSVQGADEWAERRSELLQRPDRRFDESAIRRAFADEEAFALFGSRPFLQDPRLTDECKSPSGLNKLVWDRGAGANQVFLSHATDNSPRPIPAGEAIWHLLAWLYYGTSGRCTSRTVNGQSEANTTAGPLRRSLSVHPLGANLFDTLILNLVHKGGTALQDLAPWDRQELHDPLGAPPGPAGLAWNLTGRFRHAVLLVPDASGRNVADAYVTWAWREPHAPADDPYVPYQQNQKGEAYPLYAHADRAIWRDLDALLLELPAGHRSSRPDVLSQINDLPSNQCDAIRLKTFGYDQDGQTRDKAYFQAITPPVLAALKSSDLADRIRRAHEYGTDTGEALRRSLHGTWVGVAGKPRKAAPWSDRAMADYWTRAGALFWKLVQSDEPMPLLPNAFIIFAVEAYEAATAAYAQKPGVIKTIEHHRSQLFRGWKKRPVDEPTAGNDASGGRDHVLGPDDGQDQYDW